MLKIGDEIRGLDHGFLGTRKLRGTIVGLMPLGIVVLVKSKHGLVYSCFTSNVKLVSGPHETN